MQRIASAVWPSDFNRGNGSILTAGGVLAATRCSWSTRSATDWTVAESQPDITANHSGMDTEPLIGIVHAAKAGSPISRRSNARVGRNATREA